MTSFASRVLAVVKRIPPGRVATYGDVAEMAGRPRAHRAVGNIMRECRDNSVPCQRVVAAGGAIGGYGGNVELKKSLLRAEGVAVVGRRIRQFADVRWTGGGGATGKRRTQSARRRAPIPKDYLRAK